MLKHVCREWGVRFGLGARTTFCRFPLFFLCLLLRVSYHTPYFSSFPISSYINQMHFVAPFVALSLVSRILREVDEGLSRLMHVCRRASTNKQSRRASVASEKLKKSPSLAMSSPSKCAPTIVVVVACTGRRRITAACFWC